ncbi:ABC transporter substrate-binding protein [Methylobacterium indicum]|uniref:ABC transporter substrate-binding protein n=1 Tax=Methylobacterium indicum TaxID=1775910 RepID=A0ABR5HJE5_9HYPH|nr:ABC transporter substrate-binding protein [Methylobacterium indicum]KMO15298.1 ABC transporter substrate-binding protein [Methylobacterium indicum]KMO26894.1 ABC transporter substrate-binding protein [Methylobacterium indicum]
MTSPLTSLPKVSVLTRRHVVTALGASAALAGSRAARAASAAKGIYPVATCSYMVLFAAQGLGYFKDEGLDSRLVQGGSGVKTREIIASGQGDFALADFVHPMLLTNKGRPCKALTAVDRIAAGLQFMIRADLYAQGITDLAKFVAWKRPDGRKPLVGVSSIGGTTHVWSTYFLEKLGYDGMVTWLGVGNVDTMLGSLKTKQVDVLINTYSLVGEVERQGYGKLLYDGSDPRNWDTVIGGTVPVTVNYCLQARIDRDPALVQAWTNAVMRAGQWIDKHDPEEIYGTIEPFVGSTSRESNLIEIKATKAVGNPAGLIDQAAFDRGAKVWFREMTGVQKLPLDAVYAARFAEAAAAKYPA